MVGAREAEISEVAFRADIGGGWSEERCGFPAVSAPKILFRNPLSGWDSGRLGRHVKNQNISSVRAEIFVCINYCSSF